MVDCDIYSASREALWFSEPLIHDMAVIFFDDWGWRAGSDEGGSEGGVCRVFGRVSHAQLRRRSRPTFRKPASFSSSGMPRQQGNET